MPVPKTTGLLLFILFAAIILFVISCTGNDGSDGEDGGLYTYFIDADEDGFGDPNVSVDAASVPTGYVLDSSDCDDGNAAVHPGATEICDDLTDNDCDRMVDGEDSDCGGIGRWVPNVTDTWQWQLSGTVNTGYDVAIYDIDLFDSPAELLDQLHDSGRKVICYFSAGSYEDWRPDEDAFVGSDLGETLDGWPDERWVDITSSNVRQIMLARLDLAMQKGCDAVEPDNVDGYANDTGFPLTSADQLEYNRFLALAAHERNLAIALKNDLDQVADLVSDYDLAVNEQCHEYDECDALTPFIDAGKPVLNAEYASVYISDTARRNSLCNDSLNRSFQTLVLPLDLDDSFRFSCN